MDGPGQGYVVEAGRRDAGRLRTLWRYRGLVWSFTLRELQVRYRQAFLGFAWALLQPVALTFVSTLIFARLLGFSSPGAPYPLFVYTALAAWMFFQTAVTAAVPSLVSNANLVRKIWFPREALPLGTVLAVGTDLLAGLALWVVLLLAYGYGPAPAWLWIVPLLCILLAFTAACALFGAAVNVRFRDVKHALPLVLQLLFFVSPVVYSASAVPARWRALYDLNPLVAVIEGMRAIALDARAPDVASLGVGAGVAFGLLVVAYGVYITTDRRFADVI